VRTHACVWLAVSVPVPLEHAIIRCGETPVYRLRYILLESLFVLVCMVVSIQTNTPFVCAWGGGGLTQQGCARIYLCNMIQTQIGGQEQNGPIEPVQRVRWSVNTIMMHSLTVQAHHGEVFTHVVVRFDLDAGFGRHMALIRMSQDTHVNESWHTYE